MRWNQFPWIRRILSDNSQEIIFQKSSQMGVSTYCYLWLMWLCKTRQAPRGVIFWQPTDGMVKDFVASKVDPFIAENLDNIFTGIKDESNNLGLKFIFGVPTFWRGLKSKVDVKAISGDAAIYDEYDESDPSQIKQAEKRLSASTVKLVRRLSTPTLPDYGINKDFQLTDQCHYAFKCSGCSTWNVLEEYFPRCLQINKLGHYYRACQKCKNELDIKKGKWVSDHRSPIRGYQISQLYSPFVSADEIMNEFLTTEFPGHFHNHVLGLPWLSAEDKVTTEQVLGLCDSQTTMRSDSVVSTVMGVDVGTKLNVVVLLPSGDLTRLVWCGELNTFEELDNVIERFKVSEFVMDALPEQRKAREVIERHKFRGWLCFYNDNQKGSYAWKEDERIVSVNRTESLDVGTLSINRRKLILPQRVPAIEVFAKQCANIAKVCEEDKETGAKKYSYKRLGPDHYRHALNYAQLCIAHRPWQSVISIFR